MVHGMTGRNEKRIVITGVSRGLGRALVEGFVAGSHTVFGCARAAAAMAELSERYPVPHQFDMVDVADNGQVQRWAERLLAAGPAPDLLINNAGLINRNAPLWKVPPGEVDSVLDVNVQGTINVIRHFVPAMIDRGRGVIVNMSSGWGRSASADVAPYCASKWAIEGLTRALADELPRGLAAVPLNPGVIHTEMLESCFGASAADYPSPEAWAQRAVALLQKLGPADNGRPASV